ncbi:ABC transporter permease [Aquibacillus koreensis]|uniref:ABC transporter permease n=1 Tax=Aquibacillus koreensis TaxID=279446 RepID=A0A9X4AIN9_9BACI|nr:ABC transporter permease [Aquibacillus koreensis]MCT2536307.1 ABC transporter permease [Aquibacillus koreensis]MDC3421342.1 ABC transporter permease [Aquibacillus koreensis]
MAILKIILRKMINNRWLTASLFLGLLITVSLVSTIPTYTSSVIHKLLVKDLESYQQEEGKYPATFSYSVNFSKDDGINRANTLQTLEDFHGELVKSTTIPTVSDSRILSTAPLPISLQEDNTTQVSGRIMAFSNIENHIEITDGRLPEDTDNEKVYEAIVPEEALLEREMVIGTTFTVTNGNNSFSIKPVGTFIVKSGSDPYWSLPPDTYNKDFIIPEQSFRNDLINENEALLETGKFVTAFDYTTIKQEQIPVLLNLERKVNAKISGMMETILITDFGIQDVLQQYEQRSQQLTVMLWSLNAPILVMLAIYLFMVSRLIIDRQRNEIAVFASRGANRFQISFIYLIEVVILGTIALLIGPYIGLLFCQILGATNGFLQFVQRTTLPVEISFDAYLYGLVALGASIIMIMLPIYFASNKSIVHQKQNLAQSIKQYKWYSILFDLTFIGVALYGYYSFQTKQTQLQSVDGNLYMDPMLFFLPAIFLIGMGLFLLRTYPLLLKLIFKIGERFWSLSLYGTLLQVSRSGKQYQYFMLFLIMTIGLGVFSASAARTINSNLEEQIRYDNGANIRADVKWESSDIAISPLSNETSSDSEEPPISKAVYTEPPFEPFLDVNGIEQATKVFLKEPIKVEGKGQQLFSTQLMAIEPKQFGETAWFKSDLLPHHWHAYLNLLAAEPSAVLISSSVATSLGVKEGDYLSLAWEGSEQADFVIYGVIDYWPSFNPIETLQNSNDPSLIVANLPYVQNTMGLEPYQVWINASSNNTRSTLYSEMRQVGLPIIGMDDVQPKLTELKNDAFLLGLNGTMTLGFIISIGITFIGFLLYWVLTIKSRTLQYGIYRAMGMPLYSLFGILFWEQILTSGLACILGVLIGGLTSFLFVPLFQLTFPPEKVVPPFEVIFDASDEWKIYIFVSFMLVIGLAVLTVLLRKIKIHQAIKLGDD